VDNDTIVYEIFMIFQILDNKTECKTLYADGTLYKEAPADLKGTWEYKPNLPPEVEFAKLYCKGSSIGDACPEHLKGEWAKTGGKLKAYLNSFMQAKISLEEHCFYDLVPQHFLLDFYEVKNKITKQLNNLFRGINTLERAANIPKKIITTAKKSIPPLKLSIKSVTFIPSTVSTPIPVGPILIAEDAIEALKDLIDVNKGKLGFNNFQITMLKTELKKVLDLLKILDFLIQTSAEELSNAGGLDNKKQNEITTQESISKELLDSTQNQSNQLSPVVKDVNGFKMEVITIDGGIDTNLKRRQAVARNSQGIIMLKGDQSFSSNDQILIDELVYYIQQNDLKA